MKSFAQENYGNSHHFWYQVDTTQSHEYGAIFNHQTDWLASLVTVIKEDLNKFPIEDDFYWYFGQSLETMPLMIRFKEGNYELQTNLKDFDFALHLDAINEWKAEFQKQLKS
ncbi:hypothetical protein A9Q68_06615 [Streptococcus bovimastitidis]|uniref:DUF600 family protein n=1 Tax=Streptococcus bovimastitidis TaxID=1856638 RepID=A0A1L8MLK8_9STRE|nr:hypothetical protein [Streptococcus bovimastitidis]OJF71654.1 hypothetical protein A9Q68_06615 [Streptococcus bovimastitidis]